MPVPQVAQFPVQMTVHSAQVQMQSANTDQAMLGHMRYVMMQVKDMTIGYNWCYMEMSEIPREGEPDLNS